jgi:tetratricopeptide (TPR) repeat protein
MDCPRCGATTVSAPECPRCGVILAKARADRPPRAASLPLASPPSAWRALAVPLLGLVLLAGAAVVHLRRSPPPGAPAPSAPSALLRSPAGPGARPEPEDLPPAIASPHPLAPPPEVADAALRAARAADADREAAARLSGRLQAGASLTAEDVRAAEALFDRYPAVARDLLEAVLLSAAAGHRETRRYDAAAALLERARVVAPASPRGPKALLALRLATGDWAAAESTAREVLAGAPSEAEAARGLAYALVRQDRSREAIDVLAAFLERYPDPETRSLLDRFRRDQGPEAALDEARLAHFHLRYDGDAHEEVGREILRVLDRHYATLVLAFDHQPAAPIPVVLLSTQSYHDSTGAPAWSGGQYDSFDGRVRLPIGGLTTSLTPDLDDALLHELTHAFVADLSRGVAPRELHEGLAQFMEGQRFHARLGDKGASALADGRLRGVGAFYLSALGLVEDLVGQHGQGGINELLRAMAESGSSDDAFRRVYGKSLGELQRDWAVRLRQRYGS